MILNTSPGSLRLRLLSSFFFLSCTNFMESKSTNQSVNQYQSKKRTFLSSEYWQTRTAVRFSIFIKCCHINTVGYFFFEVCNINSSCLAAGVYQSYHRTWVPKVCHFYNVAAHWSIKEFEGWFPLNTYVVVTCVKCFEVLGRSWRSCMERKEFKGSIQHQHYKKSHMTPNLGTSKPGGFRNVFNRRVNWASYLIALNLKSIKEQ